MKPLIPTSNPPRIYTPEQQAAINATLETLFQAVTIDKASKAELVNYIIIQGGAVLYPK